MEFINQFKTYLLQGKQKHSKITVKNYLSDVRKFINWYESAFGKEFEAWLITHEIISRYKTQLTSNSQSNIYSARSLKRYLSSLRKFYSFLLSQKLVSVNPFEPNSNITQPIDYWHIKEFSNHLFLTQASKLTLKNYLMDIKQFKDWFSQVNAAQTQLQSSISPLEMLNAKVVDEYKNRLLYDAKLSPLSVNRKLSSLRKYLAWAKTQGFLKRNIQFNQTAVAMVEPKDEPAILPNPDLNQLRDVPQIGKINKQTKYSKFPPLRLLQKITNGSTYLFDLLIMAPVVNLASSAKYGLWKFSGRKVFVPVEELLKKQTPTETTKHILSPNVAALDSFITNQPQINLRQIRSIPKSIYAPLNISTKDFPIGLKILHHLRYTRPAWYKKYHSYRFVHYIHFAVVLIYTTILGLTIYQAMIESPHFQTPVLASRSSSPRMLAFKGTLTDAYAAPITKDVTLRFTLYNNPTATGSAMLWQETQAIQPDDNGNFSTNLGKNTPIYQSLLNDNSNLFLGITIGKNPELAPRQQIATTAYTQDSEKLQGLLPITDPNAKSTNVILALNSSGDLTIGGSASPRFEATGGEFTLSGQTLTLTTAEGSNTNVQIKPDGSGIVDIQKPIQNTTNYNSAVGMDGAVEIDDSVAILANESSHSALLINQNSTGDLISASGSGTAKFTVNYVGAGMFAGDLAVNGNNLTSKSPTFNLLNANVSTLNIANQATEVSIASGSGTTTINNDLTVKGALTAKTGIVIPENQSIKFSGLTAGGLSFLDNNKQFAQDANNLFWDQAGKRLGLGTNAPLFRLDVRDDQAATAAAQIYNTSTSTNASGLTIKLGISAPTNTNNFLSFQNGDGLIVGKITGNNPTNNNVVYNTGGADYAEYYKKADIFETFETGDVVCIASGGVTKCKDKAKMLGVVSATAGFVGAGNHDNDPTYVLVGIVGQLPVKVADGVSLTSGDPVTLDTNTQGITKATTPGMIIGHALEDYTSSASKPGLVKVALNVSWHDDEALLTTAGNLKGWQTNQTPAVPSPLDNIIGSIKASLIEAGQISSQQISAATANFASVVADTILTQKIVSPIADVSHVRTNVISPLADDPKIALEFSESQISVTNPKNASAAAVATIDNEGNASFAGDVEARQASFSGTLRAKKIIADEIDLSDEALAKLGKSVTNTASPSSTFITNVYNIATQSASKEIAQNEIQNTQYKIPDTTFSAEFARFNQGLIALGASSLSNVAISGDLRVGQNLIISENSLNTVGTDLSLQSLRQGNLSLMGDLVKIDTEGNLSVAGNATFAKDVTIKGKLAANVIAPVPDQDLLFQLPEEKPGKSNKFEIQTATGSGVLSINQIGDVIASGSGKFANIAAKTFSIIRGAQADTSFTRTEADGSAGVAVITAYETERTIVSPYMKPNSLVYITAISDTQNVTPYIARQTANSFTIQIPRSVTKDIKLNWWILN